MSLPTPPCSSHRDKENRTPRMASGSRVAWSQNNKYHNVSSLTPQAFSGSASKDAPSKSILKRSSEPLLPLLVEKSREVTPEPGDPLVDLHYLEWPVSRILASDASLRDLIEAYSILAARLSSAVQESTDADCSWPLFQPLRTHRKVLVESIIKDLGKAMVDPLAGVVEVVDAGHESPTEERGVLPSPRKSPRKKKEHDRGTDRELGSILTEVLTITFAQELPTLNSRKTRALAIWLIQTQRLPSEVLLPADDRIAYALRRAIEGELGKEGKKGSINDGLKAIHDLSLYEPSIFVPAFTELLPSVLNNLLAPTLSIRTQACHALGGFALASSRVPLSPIHTQISQMVALFLTALPPTPSLTSSPNRTNMDPPIIRTLRATLNATEFQSAAQGPVWALCVLASFVILLGPALCESTKLTRILSALFAVAIRNKKSSVRALTCLIWRCIVWVYFRPPLPQSDATDGDDDPENFTMTPEEADKRQSFWRFVRSVVDFGAGISAVGALLAAHTDDEKVVKKVMISLKLMVQKSGDSCNDAMEVMRRLVGPETAHQWDWNKLLPQALFSSNPGLLSADFNLLSFAVSPLFDHVPIPDSVRALTTTELAIEGVFDSLVELWRAGIARVNLSVDAQLPSELLDIWKGLLHTSLTGFQESEDENGLLRLAGRAASALVNVLEDSEIELVPTADTVTREADEEVSVGLKPHTRSNAAMKLAITRDLWEVVCKVLPKHECGVAGEELLTYLVKNESDLVWETDSPHDARTQWALLCTEVLAHCVATPFKGFWGVKGAMKQCDWQWTVEVRSLVWRTFTKRWHEIAPSQWETALQLLAVPFADRNSWDMSNDDLDAWEATLRFCMEKSLDEGVESLRILNHVAGAILSTHIPTSASSTRVIDILLSHFEISEVSEIPGALLELANDTLQSTYPPEPRNKITSLWLIRTVTRMVDTCPIDLLNYVLQAIQEGVATWIADAYGVFTHDEYSFDIVPLYQTIVICLRSLTPSIDTLTALTPLLASGFSGRVDKPEPISQVFTDFWHATYSKITPPEDGWPEELLAHIIVPDAKVVSMQIPVNTVHLPTTQRPDEEMDASSSSSYAESVDSIASPFELSSSPATTPIDVEKIEGMPFGFPPPRTPSPVSYCPTTPKAMASLLPSTPHVSSKSTISSAKYGGFSPLSPLASAFVDGVTLPATSKSAPRHESRSPLSYKNVVDKENASLQVPLTSVMDRIAARSPGTSALGKRPSEHGAADERPVKRSKLSATSPSPTTVIGDLASLPLMRACAQSPFQFDGSASDSEDECLTVEKSLFSTPSLGEMSRVLVDRFPEHVTALHRNIALSSSQPSKKRKRIVIDAVEVPLLRDLRRLERRGSMQTVQITTRGSLKRIQSLPVTKTLDSPPRPAVRHGKARASQSHTEVVSLSLSSSPLRALEKAQVAGSDDSIDLTQERPGNASSLSSDDDPYIGQVTPHHLFSPAMRRFQDALDRDPSSDDSNVSDSPSRDRMTRKMRRMGFEVDRKASPLKFQMRKLKF
ncbi:hypothetical protein EW146_g848 [Bondarzewia mesenterica]|uniref:Telomere-associated protein Rif1 N-terminal domain-containing protein n=1 Tax=Bondarzewia mesenterica TaxID=1095465 RepID=A0A4S4M5P1_9AGAM|nr:hypothetical protein EW146_g848 [Bondarzewia mesenterica]